MSNLDRTRAVSQEAQEHTLTHKSKVLWADEGKEGTQRSFKCNITMSLFHITIMM